MVHALLDTISKRKSFMCASDDYDDFFGIHDGPDTDRERHFRNQGYVIVEKTRIGDDCVVCLSQLSQE
jgi:hypothetical protein